MLKTRFLWFFVIQNLFHFYASTFGIQLSVAFILFIFLILHIHNWNYNLISDFFIETGYFSSNFIAFLIVIRLQSGLRTRVFASFPIQFLRPVEQIIIK